MALCREAHTRGNTVDDAVTQNACNVGKSRKPNLDMRGIYLEKFRFTAGEFYPELAEVGKRKAVAIEPRQVESGIVRRVREHRFPS
jgi:hypothetical protein